MKIFITASKQFYPEVERVKDVLEEAGHTVTPPNGYEEPEAEKSMQDVSAEKHQQWKADMLRRDAEIVGANDAILVLNFEKHGQANYIGGAAFLEMYSAFMQGKKIFLYHPIPEGMLKDEILGMNPLVINGDLSLIQ